MVTADMGVVWGVLCVSKLSPMFPYKSLISSSLVMIFLVDYLEDLWRTSSRLVINDNRIQVKSAGYRV